MACRKLLEFAKPNKIELFNHPVALFPFLISAVPITSRLCVGTVLLIPKLPLESIVKRGVEAKSIEFITLNLSPSALSSPILHPPATPCTLIDI